MHQPIPLQASKAINNFFGHPLFRHFNTSLLLLTALANCFIVQALSTINTAVVSYYEVSALVVSLCALQFMLIHPFSGIIANYLLDNYPLKLTISINALLVTVGCAFRLLIEKHFAFVIIGNAIVAIGSIGIVNCPAKYSSIWYAPNERLAVTSLMVYSSAISGGIGAVISPLLVQNGLELQEGKDQVYQLMLLHMFLISSIMVLNLLFFRGQPNKRKQQESEQLLEQEPTSETPQQVHKKYKYLKTLQKLLTCPVYLKCLIAFLPVLSVLNSFSTHVELYIKPFGLNSTDAGIATGVAVVFGLLGSVIFSLIIRRSNQYKVGICLLLFSSILFQLMQILCLILHFRLGYFFFVALYGLTLYPLFPAIIQYACEGCYPIGEGVITGLLIGFGQLFSFAMGTVQGLFLNDANGAIGSIMTNAAMYSLSLLAMLFTKQSLKRMENSAHPLTRASNDSR